MSTKQSSQHTPSETMAPLSLPAIEPPSPPQFPTFQQLVELDRESLQRTLAAPPRRLNDLFDGILGDLAPLLADYQTNPEKYGEETHELLEQLTHGSKLLEQLSANERVLLNRATFDFYQAVPPKKPVPLVKQAEAKDPADELEGAESEGADAEKPEAPVPGVDVPVTELPAYWWLQK